MMCTRFLSWSPFGELANTHQFLWHAAQGIWRKLNALGCPLPLFGMRMHLLLLQAMLVTHSADRVCMFLVLMAGLILWDSSLCLLMAGLILLDSSLFFCGPRGLARMMVTFGDLAQPHHLLVCATDE